MRSSFIFATAPRSASIFFSSLPEMNVVVMLPGVVEEACILAETPLHHVFERFSFPLGSFEEVVAVVDVGEMVLVVMIFERLARHVGGERVVGVGKIRQRERHRIAPQMVKWAGGPGENRTADATAARRSRFPIYSLGRRGGRSNAWNSLPLHPRPRTQPTRVPRSASGNTHACG